MHIRPQVCAPPDAWDVRRGLQLRRRRGTGQLNAGRRGRGCRRRGGVLAGERGGRVPRW